MKHFDSEYKKFRAFLMRNLKSEHNLEMSRSVASVFENSTEQSDYVAGLLLAKAESQPRLKQALLKWHPSIYRDKAWLDSRLRFSSLS